MYFKLSQIVHFILPDFIKLSGCDNVHYDKEDILHASMK